MAFVSGLTSLTKDSQSKFSYGSGILVRNINLQELRDNGIADAINPANTWTSANGVTYTPSPFGATSGGLTVEPGLVFEPVEVDGVIANIAGLDQIVSANPVISGNVLEVNDPQKMRELLVSTTIEETDSGFTEITPSFCIGPEDYLGNIAFFSRVGDCKTSSGNYIVWVVLNPIASIGSFSTEQNKAIGVPARYEGRTTFDDPQGIPLRVFVPKTAGSGSGS